MEKHTPVLLNEVIQEFEAIKKEHIAVLDCTLGQAGHSIELFKKLNKGVLVSIDLSIDSIEWVADAYEFEMDEDGFLYKEENNGEKIWYIFQKDFAQADSLLKLLNLKEFDFILADLGFSNFQLGLNLGISYTFTRQRLDMRYFTDSGITAAEVLNTAEPKELEKIFSQLGQIEFPKPLVSEIVSKREYRPFERVEDVLGILNKRKFPPNYKVKFFQALRSFVNSENARLEKLLKKMPELLSSEGKGAIITFNSIEERLITYHLDTIKLIEPNITEIIKNPQSRSAKLYIYNKKYQHKDQDES